MTTNKTLIDPSCATSKKASKDTSLNVKSTVLESTDDESKQIKNNETTEGFSSFGFSKELL